MGYKRLRYRNMYRDHYRNMQFKELYLGRYRSKHRSDYHLSLFRNDTSISDILDTYNKKYNKGGRVSYLARFFLRIYQRFSFLLDYNALYRHGYYTYAAEYIDAPDSLYTNFLTERSRTLVSKINILSRRTYMHINKLFHIYDPFYAHIRNIIKYTTLSNNIIFKYRCYSLTTNILLFTSSEKNTHCIKANFHSICYLSAMYTMMASTYRCNTNTYSLYALCLYTHTSSQEAIFSCLLRYCRRAYAMILSIHIMCCQFFLAHEIARVSASCDVTSIYSISTIFRGGIIGSRITCYDSFELRNLGYFSASKTLFSSSRVHGSILHIDALFNQRARYMNTDTEMNTNTDTDTDNDLDTYNLMDYTVKYSFEYFRLWVDINSQYTSSLDILCSVKTLNLPIHFPLYTSSGSLMHRLCSTSFSYRYIIINNYILRVYRIMQMLILNNSDLERSSTYSNNVLDMLKNKLYMRDNAIFIKNSYRRIVMLLKYKIYYFFDILLRKFIKVRKINIRILSMLFFRIFKKILLNRRHMSLRYIRTFLHRFFYFFRRARRDIRRRIERGRYTKWYNRFRFRFRYRRGVIPRVPSLSNKLLPHSVRNILFFIRHLDISIYDFSKLCERIGISNGLSLDVFILLEMSMYNFLSKHFYCIFNSTDIITSINNISYFPDYNNRFTAMEVGDIIEYHASNNKIKSVYTDSFILFFNIFVCCKLSIIRAILFKEIICFISALLSIEDRLMHIIQYPLYKYYPRWLFGRPEHKYFVRPLHYYFSSLLYRAYMPWLSFSLFNFPRAQKSFLTFVNKLASTHKFIITNILSFASYNAQFSFVVNTASCQWLLQTLLLNNYSPRASYEWVSSAIAVNFIRVISAITIFNSHKSISRYACEHILNVNAQYNHYVLRNINNNMSSRAYINAQANNILYRSARLPYTTMERKLGLPLVFARYNKEPCKHLDNSRRIKQLPAFTYCLHRRKMLTGVTKVSPRKYFILYSTFLLLYYNLRTQDDAVTSMRTYNTLYTSILKSCFNASAKDTIRILTLFNKPKYSINYFGSNNWFTFDVSAKNLLRSPNIITTFPASASSRNTSFLYYFPEEISNEITLFSPNINMLLDAQIENIRERHIAKDPLSIMYSRYAKKIAKIKSKFLRRFKLKASNFYSYYDMYRMLHMQRSYIDRPIIISEPRQKPSKRRYISRVLRSIFQDKAMHLFFRRYTRERRRARSLLYRNFQYNRRIPNAARRRFSYIIMRRSLRRMSGSMEFISKRLPQTISTKFLSEATNILRFYSLNNLVPWSGNSYCHVEDIDSAEQIQQLIHFVIRSIISKFISESCLYISGNMLSVFVHVSDSIYALHSSMVSAFATSALDNSYLTTSFLNHGLRTTYFVDLSNNI